MAKLDTIFNEELKNVAAQNMSSTPQSSTTQSGTANQSVAPLSVPTSISSSSLQPVTPINVSQPKPAVEAVGLGAVLEKNASDYVKNLETEAESKKVTSENSFDAYLKDVMNTPGEVALTSEAYSDTVDPAKAELDRINNQIIQEQVSLRRKIQEIEKNPQGLFGRALQDQIDKVTNESISKQADLAVIQLSKQGAYDSAKEIADRAVAVKLEQQRNRNEALKLTYENNKDAFTTSEQRAFEAKSKERDIELARREKELTDIGDLSIEALQNGAPASVAIAMRKADTVDEALSIGGGYVGLLDRQLKRAQIANESKVSSTIQVQNILASSGITNPSKNDLAIANSALFDKELDSTQIDNLQKAQTVLSGVETLNSLFQEGGIDLTGPVTGRVRGLLTMFGTDANAAAINATIQGLVPNVARGIFGEVGVLTNADIENYKKTIPNLRGTEEQNKVVSVIMLDVLQRSLENALTTNALAGRNVSRFLPILSDVRSRVANEKAKLGITTYSGMDDSTFLDTVTNISADGLQPTDITSLVNNLVSTK